MVLVVAFEDEGRYVTTMQHAFLGDICEVWDILDN